MADIPQPVQLFIAKNIHTLSELEVLLFLRDRSGSKWAAHEIGKALLMHAPSVEPLLAMLRNAGLLAVVETPDVTLYQYSPSPDLATIVDEVRKWYSTHPVAITTLIFSKPIDNIIRGFADSFLLRKKKEDK